ncbi:MAG: SDR family NAD(P)-dependent oxidoreductase [Nitratireductor sp.]
MNLADRHIVVTGGGSGVGAEIAETFAALGARVSIIGRRLEPLQEVSARIGAFAVCADVGNAEALELALASTRAEFGPVAVAIANAGSAPSAPFHKITADEFQSALSVNLNGVFHLWQACLADMKQAGWGRMIAIASTAGLKGYGYVSHYCAAKHGVVGLTRALAQELGRTGITVNAICPGFIETPLLERSIETIVAQTGMTAQKAAESLMAGNPQKRFVTTAEVAQTAVWLCSDAARSINGHALALSGGET